MPRPRTVGRCETRGCRGRWALTPRNKRQRYCPTCAGARKRVRDRTQAKTTRFIRNWKAFDRAEIVRALACDYEATGWLDTYQHDPRAPWTVAEWRAIVAEAKALGESWMFDDDYQMEMAEEVAQLAAE